MLTWRDLRAAFVGIRYLLRFRPEGFLFFEPSLRGCLKSFWAALILLPFWWITLLSEVPQDKIANWDVFVQIQVASYAINWIFYPILMLPVVRLLHRQERYCLYISAYNWFQLVQILFVPLLLLMSHFGIPQFLLTIPLHAIFLAYCFYLARIGLAVEGQFAFALVFMDFMTGAFADGIAQNLSGTFAGFGVGM